MLSHWRHCVCSIRSYVYHEHYTLLIQLRQERNAWVKLAKSKITGVSLKKWFLSRRGPWSPMRWGWKAWSFTPVKKCICTTLQIIIEDSQIHRSAEAYRLSIKNYSCRSWGCNTRSSDQELPLNSVVGPPVLVLATCSLLIVWIMTPDLK